MLSQSKLYFLHFIMSLMWTYGNLIDFIRKVKMIK